MGDVKWFGDQVFAEMMRVADDKVDEIALEVHAEAVNRLNRRGTGRIYRRKAITSTAKKYGAMGARVVDYTPKGKAKYAVGYRIHQASAPGEPPAPDTHDLRTSVVVEFKGRAWRRVGTPLRRGRDLERGTKRVKPRPWLRPSLEAVKARHR